MALMRCTGAVASPPISQSPLPLPCPTPCPAMPPRACADSPAPPAPPCPSLLFPKQDTEKKIKAVCVVHNETTTGVTSDIGGCRKAMDASGHPALLLVDGVSSIGALEFKFDDWRVDVAVTGSQKALSLPTGLGLVCASQKALDMGKTAKLRRCYFDFADMLKTNPSGNVPYTPCLSLLYGLQASLDLLKVGGGCGGGSRGKRGLRGCSDAPARVPGQPTPPSPCLAGPARCQAHAPTSPSPHLSPSLALSPCLQAEGMDNVYARHHRLAEGTRKAVAGWGLELLCKNPRWQSDSLTVIEVPQGIDSNLIVKNAYARYNLSIGVGLSKVNGKVCRASWVPGFLGPGSQALAVPAGAACCSKPTASGLCTRYYTLRHALPPAMGGSQLTPPPLTPAPLRSSASATSATWMSSCSLARWRAWRWR